MFKIKIHTKATDCIGDNFTFHRLRRKTVRRTRSTVRRRNHECNGTRTCPNPKKPAAVALPGLPADVAGYTQWLKLNADPIPPVPGGDPHNGTKKRLC